MSRIETIVVAPTTPQKSAPGRFEAALQGAARSLARSVVGAVELAAPAVPFGTVLAGAVRAGSSGPGEVAGRAVAAASPAGGALAAGGGAAGAPTAGSPGDLVEATRALQQEAQAMNLQYLQLQEQMQRESREYTALSNGVPDPGAARGLGAATPVGAGYPAAATWRAGPRLEAYCPGLEARPLRHGLWTSP